MNATTPAPTDESTREILTRHGGGPWLLEVGEQSSARSLVMAVGSTCTIGTSREADIRVTDPTVSGLHARVRAIPSGLVVEDLDSKNGLFVGAAKVDSVLATPGSMLVAGRTSLRVDVPTPKPERGGLGEPIPGVVGESLPMRRLAFRVRRFAPLNAPVMILGETGSGKDMVAQALHRLARRRGPYVPLNVGAIAPSLADTELFGHHRGAFTGAVANRPGAFEQAHGGTLFLDEIAQLSPSLQVKLLRVVEDKLVRPVGGAQPVAVDVRIVSATNEPVAQRAKAGTFREDLFHRLAMVVLTIPPLRDRKTDIPALSQALLRRSEPELGPRELSSQALGMLLSYRWPGNVRELGAVLYRAAVQSSGALITAEHMQTALPAVMRSCRERSAQEIDAHRLLAAHDGNVTQAARSAGVARSTFRAWLRRGRGLVAG